MATIPRRDGAPSAARSFFYSGSGEAAVKEIVLTPEGYEKLKDMETNKTVEYRIVGSAEANPTEAKLSNESPVGKAIMGRKKGEVVEVAAPRGALKFKILDIRAA